MENMSNKPEEPKQLPVVYPKGNWWTAGTPWKEPVQLEFPIHSAAAALKDPKFRYTNPACKHECCSWDVMNCDACAVFTKMKLEGELAEEVKTGQTSAPLGLPNTPPTR